MFAYEINPKTQTQEDGGGSETWRKSDIESFNTFRGPMPILTEAASPGRQQPVSSVSSLISHNMLIRRFL